MKASTYAAPVLATSLILFSFSGLFSHILSSQSTVIDEEPTVKVQKASTDSGARGIALVIRTGAGFVANTMTAQIKHAASGTKG